MASDIDGTCDKVRVLVLVPIFVLVLEHRFVLGWLHFVIFVADSERMISLVSNEAMSSATDAAWLIFLVLVFRLSKVWLILPAGDHGAVGKF